MTKSIFIAEGVEVRFVGSIERGGPDRGYRWYDGYAVFVGGQEHQPWMLKRAAVALARKLAEARREK